MELVDFPATVYDLAGIEVEHWQFGCSVAPMFDARAAHRDAVFCEGGRLRANARRLNTRVALGETPALLADSAAVGRDGRASAQQGDHGRTEDFKYIRRLYGEDELQICARTCEPTI